jgi:ABC-type nitrate/sulfonate/bicarbonate transport system permease component
MDKHLPMADLVVKSRVHLPRPSLRFGAMAWGGLGVVILVAIWWIAALVTGSNAILPGPDAVLRDFQSNFFGNRGLEYLGIKNSGYAENLAWTIGLALVSWVVGSFIGTTVGVLSARLQWVRNVTEPLLFVFGAVPLLVFAPFCLIWFGNGPAGKLVLIIFYCFITTSLVAQSAALALPPVNEEYAATLGVSSRRRFLTVLVPSTFPAMFTGIRVALATAIGLQTTAELLGSTMGVGRLISINAAHGSIPSVLSLSISVGIVALLLDTLLRLASRAVLRWQ